MSRMLSDVSVGYLKRQQEVEERNRKETYERNKQLRDAAGQFLQASMEGLREEHKPMALQNLAEIMMLDPSKLDEKKIRKIANDKLSFLWEGTAPTIPPPQTINSSLQQPSGEQQGFIREQRPAEGMGQSAPGIPAPQFGSHIPLPNIAERPPLETAVTIPPPLPPEGYRRSAYPSESELSMKAYAESQAKMYQELAQAREKKRAEFELEREFPKPKPLETLTGKQRLYDPNTGEILVDIDPNATDIDDVKLQHVPGQLNGADRNAAFAPNSGGPFKAGHYYMVGQNGDYVDVSSHFIPMSPSTIRIVDRSQPSKALPPDLRTALDRTAMSLTSPLERVSLMDSINRMWESGDEANTIASLKQASLDRDDPGIKATVLGRRDAMLALMDIEDLLDKVPQNLLSGTVEDTIRRLGSTTDPKMVEVRTRLTILNQAYRQAITGKAFSEKEAEEYAGMFPSYRNTAPVNKAELKAMMGAFQKYDQQYWGNRLGTGRNWSDFTEIAARRRIPESTRAGPYEPPPIPSPGGAAAAGAAERPMQIHEGYEYNWDSKKNVYVKGKKVAR